HRPQLRRHPDAGLGDAVLAAVGAHGRRRDRRDIDDRADGLRGKALDRAAQLDHRVRDPLGEEVRAAQVDAEHAVEALRLGLQDVGAHARCDPGVVDQQVDPAPPLQRGVDVARVVVELGDRAADVDDVALLAQPRDQLGRLLAGGEDRDGVPLGEQRLGDAETDASVAPGDERDGLLAGHDGAPGTTDGTALSLPQRARNGKRFPRRCSRDVRPRPQSCVSTRSRWNRRTANRNSTTSRTTMAPAATSATGTSRSATPAAWPTTRPTTGSTTSTATPCAPWTVVARPETATTRLVPRNAIAGTTRSMITAHVQVGKYSRPSSGQPSTLTSTV